MFGTTKKNAKLYFEIIQNLYYKNKLSSVELSSITNRSIPLITKSINTLIELGYIEESGYAPSSGGRRPLIYKLNREKLFIVTVAVDQLNTRIGIVNLDNEYKASVQVFPLQLENNPNSLESLTHIISDYIGNSGIEKNKIIGIGIGMPGFIDTTLGLNYTYFNNSKQSIPKYISKK